MLGRIDSFGQKEQFLDFYKLQQASINIKENHAYLDEILDRNKNWDNLGYRFAAALVYGKRGDLERQSEMIASIVNQPTPFADACIFHARLLKKKGSLHELTFFSERIQGYPVMDNVKKKILEIARP
jgi:hypothetical protein